VIALLKNKYANVWPADYAAWQKPSSKFITRPAITTIKHSPICYFSMVTVTMMSTGQSAYDESLFSEEPDEVRFHVWFGTGCGAGNYPTDYN
jgi:hypothetical protein